MHEPEIFEKVNKGTREGASKALKIVGHLIKWKPDQHQTILDVGCGPGDVLLEVILPVFKDKFSVCYATDVSEKMIEFGAKKYADRKDVNFLQMDIMDVDGFLKEYGHVDHVVSSFVFHFVPSLETALQNVFKLLKPGGDFITVHPCSTGAFGIYEYMDQNEKWNKFFDNLKQFVPASQKSKQPVEDLRTVLSNCGFTDIVLELISTRITMDSREMMIRMFSSGHAQIHNIPQDMRAEYLEEFMDYGIEKGHFEVETASGRVSYEMKLFVVFAQKSE